MGGSQNNTNVVFTTVSGKYFLISRSLQHKHLFLNDPSPIPPPISLLLILLLLLLSLTKLILQIVLWPRISYAVTYFKLHLLHAVTYFETRIYHARPFCLEEDNSQTCFARLIKTTSRRQDIIIQDSPLSSRDSFDISWTSWTSKVLETSGAMQLKMPYMAIF